MLGGSSSLAASTAETEGLEALDTHYLGLQGQIDLNAQGFQCET